VAVVLLDSTGAYPRASVPQGTVKVQCLALNGTRRATIGLLLYARCHSAAVTSTSNDPPPAERTYHPSAFARYRTYKPEYAQVAIT
jgi:hypothetical protein